MPETAETSGGARSAPAFCGTLRGYLRYRSPEGEEHVVPFDFAPVLENRDLVLETMLDGSGHHLRLELGLRPLRPIELLEAKVELRLDPEIHREVVSGLANGWQSWSSTRELDRAATLRPPSPLIWLLRPLGDAGFTRYGTGRGVFHSWSFTHLRLRDGFLFAGSTAEDSGFTLLRADLETGAIEAEKDCAGRRLADGAYRLLGLLVERDSDLGTATDSFCKAARISARPVPGGKPFGWTSWYRYYTKIDERLMLESLDALGRLGAPVDIFQIDDGYETAVGDWLRPSPRFPHGMKPLADEARGRGMVPGIWLAPFIVERRSRVFADHPDWLLRDERGLPIPAGWNKQWSGTFYALDTTLPPVREHLREVLRTMTGEWGYGLIKADFLYAAALRGGPEMTRGERMVDALGMLREGIGESQLLACGVPLASAAGRVEHCRIGPDVSPYWEDRMLEKLDYGERVSTRSSLENTICRAHLQGRFFANDPDVFILRRGLTKLSPLEARTLFVVNSLLSGVLLFSDDPDAYGLEKQLLLRGLPLRAPERIEAAPDGGCYRIELGLGGCRYLLLVNLGSERRALALAPEQLRADLAFDQLEGELLEAGAGLAVELPAHGCRLFKLSVLDGGDQVLGTTAHLLGGAGDVAGLKRVDGGIELQPAPGLRARGRAWIALADVREGERVRVGGREQTVRRLGRALYVEASLEPGD